MVRTPSLIFFVFCSYSYVYIIRVHLFYQMSKLRRERILRVGKLILKITSLSHFNCMKVVQFWWTGQENRWGVQTQLSPMIDRCRKWTHYAIGCCIFRSSLGNSNVHVRTTRNRAYVCSFQLFFFKGARARLKGVTGVLGGCVSGSNFLYRCMIVEIFFV